MIELIDVSKKYGMTKALDHVSLTIPRGQIIGLFGENGAGKSTLMKCILNFLSYSGSITLDGEKITNKNIVNISFATCEHSFFPGMSAEEHRAFYADHFPKFRTKRFYGLMEFFELPMYKNLRYFSTGQKNQFEVILALCQGADYILMDEPFAGSDIFNREDFYKVLLGILEPEETVLLSTHLIEEVADFVGRAILIRKGNIVADVTTLELEEQGTDLVSFIKTTYHYHPDRVSKALDSIMGGEGSV